MLVSLSHPDGAQNFMQVKKERQTDLQRDRQMRVITMDPSE